MAGEWRTATVMELQREGTLLVEDGNHGEYRPRSDEFVESGVAFIRAADMNGGRVLFSSAAKINERARARITKGIGAPGDVLLSHKGTVGKVALVPDDAPTFVCSPQTTFWRTCDERRLDRKYLYAFLRSTAFHAQLATRAGETDMAPYVSLTSQRGLCVTLPPLTEQLAIAHILGTLDDKIDLNRRMNETLEAMARALFKSWFVDFDPVRAKAEGRDPGLPKPLADLFPARLVDSELGEIPEEWCYMPLGEFVDLTRGTTYSGSLKDHPGPVLLGLASIARNGGFREDKLSTYGGSSSANLLLGPGELFASLKDVTQSADLLGAVARVPAHVKQGRLTQDTVKLAFKSATTSSHILYHTLLTPTYREYCRSHGTGTTNLGLSRDDFLAYPVVKPSAAIQCTFDAAMEKIEARACSVAEESRTLAALRDALLPKLISGELRVKDMERFAEAAPP